MYTYIHSYIRMHKNIDNYVYTYKYSTCGAMARKSDFLGVAVKVGNVSLHPQQRQQYLLNRDVAARFFLGF